MSVRTRWPHLLAAPLLLAAIVQLAPMAARAAVFNVNSTLDQPDIDSIDGICRTIANTCTLRAAVMEANVSASGGDSFIYLPAGLYQLTRPPSGINSPADSGDLNFAQPAAGVYVIGAGAGSTIIDGGGLDRVFKIEAGRFAGLHSLTVRNGAALGDYGGGILVLGQAVLSRVTVRDNQASYGGGVDAKGSYFYMWASTIRDNRANVVGGGLRGSGDVSVDRSTISGNSANFGGGVFVEPTTTLTIMESTISSNRAGNSGGGIYAQQGTVNVYSSTIAFNMADSNDDGVGDGGGLVNDQGTVNQGTVNLRNCLIAGNYIVAFFDWDDCRGTIGSYGRNLFGDTAGCSIVTGSGEWGLLNDLGTIGPLAKSGGPTQTHQLYPGSNAIDGGDPVDGCLSPTGTFPVDQRGVPRVHGVRCDVGAYEAGILFTDDFELGDLSAWPN